MRIVSTLAHSKRPVFWMIFAAILWSSFGFICYRIDEPIWEAGHHGFVLSEYPHNALNYVRFGYLDTKLGLATDYGEIEPAGGFSYRIDHGFITSILISFVYRIFGVHEWTGRLFPAILSVGTAVVTFLLMLNLSGKHVTALVALAFCALSPMQIYYGRLPAPHNVAVFFSILVFYFYWLWLVKKHSYWLISVFVVLVIGAYTDWIIYFVVAPILLHYLFFYKGQRNWWIVIILAISPLLLFAFYIVWMYWLVGDRAVEILWTTFVQRSSSAHNLEVAPTINQILYTHYDRAKYWLTIPIVILSVGWIGRFCYRLAQRKLSDSQGVILALFLFGFSHNLVFANRVMVHDFIMFYQLVPAFAMASASALTEFILRHLERKPVLTMVTVTAIFAIFIGQSLRVFKVEHSRPVTYTQSYYVGQSLNDAVSTSGKYIDAVDLYQHLGVLRTYDVADRSFLKVSTLDGLLEIYDDPVYQVVVVGNSDETEATLRRYLTENYPRENVAGYSIFKLHQSGSNVLVDDPVIEHPYSIKFGGQIEFLGFDIDEIVRRRDEQIEVWERYLNQNVELLLEYQTVFRVVNYWQKISETSADHILTTRLDTMGEEEHLYRLEQSHEGLDDLYPTSWWPVGQVIREEFEISVPIDYPSLNYVMWVGVQDNTTASLAPEGPFTPIDNNRVGVGQVYVRTASADLPLQLVAAVDRSVDVDLEKGLSLVHFGQSQEAVYPGDLLRITLTWRAQATIDHDYKVFIHLMDSEGRLITQHDAEPNMGASPTSQWVPGALVQDVHSLLLPPESSPGTHYLQVGMYTESTLERLSVLHGSEPSRDNAVILGTVEVLFPDE